jgi:hypothetical protein
MGWPLYVVFRLRCLICWLLIILYMAINHVLVHHQLYFCHWYGTTCANFNYQDFDFTLATKQLVHFFSYCDSGNHLYEINFKLWWFIEGLGPYLWAKLYWVVTWTWSSWRLLLNIIIHAIVFKDYKSKWGGIWRVSTSEGSDRKRSITWGTYYQKITLCLIWNTVK